MKKFVDLKFLKVFSVLFLFACNYVDPEAVTTNSYPQIDQLLSSQIQLLANSQLEKEVWLDGNSETKNMNLDSAGWAQELSFLQEINPNQSGYVGAFKESTNDGLLVLELNDGEKGSLTFFSQKSSNGSDLIASTVHEDKDVYVHHREVVINFSDKKIEDYQITGYQKILLKDTIRFRIRGVILN